MKKNNSPIENFILSIVSVHKKISSLSIECSKKLGFPAQGVLVLLNLKINKEGNTLGEITKFLGVDKSFTTRIIRELEKQELVKRERDSEKQRNYKIVSTEKGDMLIQKQAEKFEAIKESVFSRLTKAEIDTFEKAVEIIESIDSNDL